MTGWLDPYATYEDIDTRREQLIYLYHCNKETYGTIAKITRYAYNTVRQYVTKFYHLLKRAIEKFSPNKGKVYFVKWYDENGKLVYVKVGKTTRTVNQRMKELLNDYWVDGVRSYKVERVVECKRLNEDGLERFVQSRILKDYPWSLVPTDRFSIDLSVEEFDNYVSQY